MIEFIEQFQTDARVGLRALLRDRTFTTVAVLTIAVGVALNASMFSVVDAVLLRPPPYHNSNELVVISNAPPNGPVGPVSPAEFFDYQQLSQTVVGLTETQTFNVNISGGDVPDRIDGVAVSPGFFTMLGVPAFIGRTFTAADAQPGFSEMAVISYGAWQRLFGGARSAIGTKVRLDEDNYTIIGVMPPSFKHPLDLPGAPIDVWLPAGFRGAPWPTTPARSARIGDVLARMKPGVSLAEAQRDFDRINTSLRATYPTEYGATSPQQTAWQISVRSLDTVMARNSGRALVLLLGAVGFVLLIACANVASLLLARGATRQVETAVRAALGAQRSRLLRGLVAEYAMLIGCGVVAGMALTWATVKLVVAIAPASLPRREEIVVDWRVMVFAAGCAIVAGALAATLPIIVGARTSINDVLRAGGRSSTGGVGSTRTRSWLVVAELAASVVLLVGAGLVVRSFWNAQRIDLGFKPDHLVTAELTISLPNDRSLGRYIPPAARARYFSDVLDRLRALPGVLSVAGTAGVPLRDISPDGPVFVEGTTDDVLPRARPHSVSATYFATMGTRILRGRGITEQDRDSMPFSIVLSETAAKRLFPAGGALGK